MRLNEIISIAGTAVLITACVTGAPAPYGALPTPAQVEWQKMETNMFVHFGPNTFTSAEWGDGTESADIFAPSDLDCRQWAATAKAAGMKGIIITAKHHDGFCLWPNPVSSHTVAQSSWKDGKGDVLAELSVACREYGLGFGVYISPWDRNDPHYGTPEYNDVFRVTLESALGSYGTVFEQWFDGACGEGPNGKRQVYDWQLFNSTVYKMQPDAIIFSNVGPGCRWVGNESGSAGRTCWGTLNVGDITPGTHIDCEILNTGDMNGERWVAAETDVSIRPGWFWRESENQRVKSLQELLKIYYESVGRNSLLLLNVPADKRGHMHEIDSTRLMEFRAAVDEIFAEDLAEGALAEADNVRGNSWRFSASNLLDDDYDSYWATDDDVLTPSVTISFDGVRRFNRVMLQEYIPLGQRVSGFSIDALGTDGTWQEIARETTIGYKRIVLVPDTEATAVRLRVTSSLACPVLNRLALYQDNVYVDMETANPAAEGDVKPADEPLLADLGEGREISGFAYTPIYKGRGGCIVTYDLFVSMDGERWEKVYGEKMFDNIVNNPIRQEVDFSEPVKARYLKLVPLRTSGDGTYGVSAFESM
ncbi:MAG: alpha-L-fucosidase [Bacteroidales bacterium]|nr:alpha-L-fucosidase [Bacteroidales bacterium]